MGGISVAAVQLCIAMSWARIDVPPNTPNVYGGPANGKVHRKPSGHMFALSGVDGPTQEGSGFVGLYGTELYSIEFVGGDASLHLSFATHGVETVRAASSDVLVVEQEGSEADIVLAHKSWDLLVGRAPVVFLGKALYVAPLCNLTGDWDEEDKTYSIKEQADGTFEATYDHPSSWSKACGKLSEDGRHISIDYDNGKHDAGVLASDCNSIEWKSRGGGIWTRSVPTPPPPPGVTCSTKGYMALCQHKSGDFALAYGSNAQTKAAEAAASAEVEKIAAARLAATANLPTPALNASLAKLAAKMYSVMRVNTLSPEGICPVRWSTPDKTPHQAMWLWDSAFHAIGRSITEPSLAWEFLYSMISAAAPDGHIPIEADPWSGRLRGDTQPPVVALATMYVREAHGVNDSALAWALPRLERYVNWDFDNRDSNGDGLLEWSQGTESGMDNSPLFDNDTGVASIDFSAYHALEMTMLSYMHDALGNSSGAEHWRALAKRTSDMIHSTLWDDKDQIFYYRKNAGTGDFLRVKTPSSFAPLLLDGVSDERVKALLQHLSDPTTFNTPVPLPSVSADHPTFSTNMWRGPMWINTNWFTILGLRKYAHVPGTAEAADRLQRQTVAAVADAYEKYGTTFEYYDAAGKVPPTQLERKTDKESGGVRDYHWTAALTFWMLHRPEGTLPRSAALPHRAEVYV